MAKAFNKAIGEIYEKFYLILGYKFIDSEVEKNENFKKVGYA